VEYFPYSCREASGSCHGGISEEEGRESGKCPYPIKKAD
jgi:hypothetical protein